jgi:putative phosphoesterase
MKRILILGDVHANFPALKAVWDYVQPDRFDWIINTGDLTVYSTFPNETIAWFRKRGKKTISILGNTDRRILKIVKGKNLKKPHMQEKRVMYFWTAENLLPENVAYLKALPKKSDFSIGHIHIGIFHGCFNGPNKELFSDTADECFHHLAAEAPYHIHIMGHSHAPYHKYIDGVHFVNPGSVGRMFDGDPRASFAVLTVSADDISVEHFRVPYSIDAVVQGLAKNRLPDIYATMFRIGKKLN